MNLSKLNLPRFQKTIYLTSKPLRSEWTFCESRYKYPSFMLIDHIRTFNSKVKNISMVNMINVKSYIIA